MSAFQPQRIQEMPSAARSAPPVPSIRAVLIFLGTFAVAFAIYAIAWPAAPVQALDSNTYMSFARDISQGQVTHLPMRTPGYPLFLLLTGSSVTPTRLLFYTQLVLHFAGVASLAYLFWFLRVKRWLIASFTGLALLPPFVEPSAYVLTETLTAFLLAVAFTSLVIWLYDRLWMLLVLFCVTILGAAIVRPTYELLLPALIPFLIAAVLLGCVPRLTVWRIGWPLALALCLVTGCLEGHAFWNYKHFSYFGTSYFSALALSTKTVNVLESLPPEYHGLRDILIKYRDRTFLEPIDDHMGLNYIHRAMPEVVQYYGGDTIRAAKALQAANALLIRQKPMSYLNEIGKVAGTYWMPNDCPLGSGRSTILRALWTAGQLGLDAAFFLVVLALGGATVYCASLGLFQKRPVWLFRGRSGPLACAWLIATAIALYTFAVSCAAGTGVPRYRIPTDLLILSVCVIGISWWIESARQAPASSPSNS